jgi:uncharacterized RDD family membrane protein YckC
MHGWSPAMSGPERVAQFSDALAEHPDLVRLSRALQAPQAALRARMNAVILDLLLLGVVSQLLAGAVSHDATSATRAVVFLGVEFVYFFACEFYGGRTIGKRIFHVRVATASGAPPTAGQIALRNVLRPIDALPFFYASGLISLLRTGPARRQRIGDVAAQTTVILEPSGKTLRTPGWLLPTMTLAATLLSLAVIIPVLDGRQTRQPGATSAPGTWSSPQGAELRDGFIAGCGHGLTANERVCACIFNRIAATPPYNTPAGFETLAPALRRFEETRDTSVIPQAVIAAGRTCSAARSG